MTRKIIGEGSYGCVHRPSIHCKTNPIPGFDYKKYVSKIMKTTNAKQELAEFVIIGQIDPTNEYHLGQPILCEPNLDEVNVKNDIKKCKHIKLDAIEANPDKYSLLLLKFGGIDLKVLCNNYLEKYLEKDKTKRTDQFWIEVHHLIKGLKFFKDNGIIHNDIKPQNILFDTTNGKMKYIDFGLMRTKKDVIKSSKNNENYLGIYHWSYPFDCAFMDTEEYYKYKRRNNKIRTRVKNELSELIVSDSKNNPLDLPINKPSSFKILFTYLNPDNTIPNSSTQYGYINSFFDGFNEMIATNNYDTVLNHTADSIDIFGLGFTLQYMANCFKRLNALSLEDFTRLSAFFHKMYDFNPLTRVINIDTLLNEYEHILLETGVLTRLEKNFKNNNIVNKPPAPPVIMSVSKIDEKSPPKYLSVDLQEFADKDPILISVKCPEEKEFNPITKRCVKKCKEGYKRNDNFKCRKTKKNKLIKTKSPKICPLNKELNTKTNRCVKKCPDGYLRNEKFRCFKGTRRKK
jgi:serine/threonine protein kinase